MSDDEDKKEPDTENKTDSATRDVLDEIDAYAKALHRFSTLIGELDWPDNMKMDEDTELCVRMFRDFWRQHQRLVLDRERQKSNETGESFVSVTEKNVRDFFQRRFHKRWSFDLDDEPMNIDPKHHNPDEEHEDEASKERQRRFRDEWE
jgi:hypothetical protein